MLLFLIHWFVNPILLLILVRICFGRLRVSSFATVFLLSYFVLIYIQALSVFLYHVPELSFLIAVWLTPYLVVAGYGFVLLVSGHSKSAMARTWASPVDRSPADRRLLGLLPYISCGMVALPFIYAADVGLDSMGLIHLLRNPGEATEAITLRIGGLRSRHGGFLMTAIYSYGRALIVPLYLSVLVVYFVKGHVSRKHLAIAILSAVAFTIATGAKAPLAILLASALTAAYLVSRGKVSRTLILGGAFLTLFLPAMVYPLLYGITDASGLSVASEQLWRRLTLVPPAVTARYFEVFGNQLPHLGLQSNRLLAWVADVEYRPAAALMYEYAGGTIAGGLVNASFAASFYADWGYFGVGIGGIVVGMCLGVLQASYDVYHNDLMGTAFRAVNLMAVTQLMLTNIFSASLGRGLLSAILILWVARLALRTTASAKGKTESRQRTARTLVS